MYIDIKTVDLKPDKKKDILKLFFDLVIESILEDFGHTILTLDPQIRGDITRVSRLPNTRHSNGYYYIPIHLRELKVPQIILNIEKQISVNKFKTVKI